MPKETPSVAKLLSMVVFALTCFGLLLFLWLSFGGPIPLKPKAYEVEVPFPEATTLAEEADVRIAGVTVGNVKTKELDKDANATKVILAIDRKYAPIPANTKAILRQKTLLGETYVELTPGDEERAQAQGRRQARSRARSSRPSSSTRSSRSSSPRRATRSVTGSARRHDRSRGAARTSTSRWRTSPASPRTARACSRCSTTRRRRSSGLVKNTGVVFGALNERDGQLRDLIVNAERTFSATAEQQENLARVFEIFPTFLLESRLTLERLEDFAFNTRPLVSDLKPVADDLGPTISDLSELGPDLEKLFRRLDPNIDAAPKNLPQAERFLRGARAAVHGAARVPAGAQPGPLVRELLAGPGGALLRERRRGHAVPPAGRRRRARRAALHARVHRRDQRQQLLVPQPAAEVRARQLVRRPEQLPPGGQDRHPGELRLPARPSGGRRPHRRLGRPADPVDTGTGGEQLPPCFVQPPSLWDGRYYPFLERGEAPIGRRRSGSRARPARPHADR